MADDHRPTSGRYGDSPPPLSHNDFAGMLYTPVPVDDDGATAPVGRVPEDALGAAQRHCRALAAMYPHEPIAALAATVADQPQHVPGHTSGGQHLLYAAALLCHEQAARTATLGDARPRSAGRRLRGVGVGARGGVRWRCAKTAAGGGGVRLASWPRPVLAPSSTPRAAARLPAVRCGRSSSLARRGSPAPAGTGVPGVRRPL